jgi:hypothetical protein
MSFRAYYGLTGHLQAEPRGRRLSSWFMGPKLLSSQRSPWSPPHVQAYDKAMQDQLQRDDVDLVNEIRWQVALRNTRYRQALWCYHQQFVHSRQL